MRLKTFLEKSKHGTQVRLARYVGVKPSSVANWKKGKTKPKLKHCKLIDEFTGGLVTFADFIRQ